MTAIANNTNIGQNSSNIIQEGQSGNQKRTSSRKVEEVLGMGPQTVKYINKKDILISDDGMISIFGKVADKRYGSIKRGTTELRSTESMKNKIEEGLEEDLKICPIKSIHHIEVSVESFKHLYLEGLINYQNMTEAQVTTSLIIIKNVEFNTSKGIIKLPIFVSPEFSFAFATVNNKGITI